MALLISSAMVRCRTSNRFSSRRLALAVLALFTAFLGTSGMAQVVISQVSGGGGNSGATHKNDFIEILNTGGSAQPLAGWTVQYSSAAGTTWQATSVTGTLQPGEYFLIQESQGAAGTVNLPTPDVTGTLALSATAGKVALVNATTLLTGTCPTSNASVVDFIGFGSTATCSLGSTSATLTNTTSAIRIRWRMLPSRLW